MTRNVLIGCGLAGAAGPMPPAAVAQQGHDRGAKTKNVRKSKPKRTAIEFTLRRTAS